VSILLRYLKNKTSLAPNYVSVIGPKRVVAPSSSNVRPRGEFLVKKMPKETSKGIVANRPRGRTPCMRTLRRIQNYEDKP
jgi:hypothetical protein